MSPAIDRLFDRLSATYGVAWTRQWADVPVDRVKAAWELELAWWLQSRDRMQAVAWALESLPERCPNAIEFRNLCKQAPVKPGPRLPEPAADPARVAAELAKLRDMTHLAQHDPKDWARGIIERHERGERLNPAPLRFAFEALGLPMPAPRSARSVSTATPAP